MNRPDFRDVADFLKVPLPPRKNVNWDFVQFVIAGGFHEVLPDRGYAETFIRLVNNRSLTAAEMTSIVFGNPVSERSGPAESVSEIPGELVDYYSNLLRVVARNKHLVTPTALWLSALKLEGRVLKVPMPSMTWSRGNKEKMELVDKVGAVDIFAALEYSKLILLSRFLEDLCQCGLAECGLFFLAKSATGRTRRSYCSEEHRLKAASTSAVDRVNAYRAEVPYQEWQKLKVKYPDLTAAKYKAMKKGKSRRRS